jgi:hypothetical protein
MLLASLAALGFVACHRNVAHAPSSRGESDVAAATCAGRPNCFVERLGSIRGARNEQLEVVTVYQDNHVNSEPCPNVEYWLLADRPPSARLLVAAGLSCMQWADSGAALQSDALVYTYTGSGAPYGPSTVREVTTIALSPLRIRSQTPVVPGETAPPIPVNPRQPILDYRLDAE